jgi:hypothetical protein
MCKPNEGNLFVRALAWLLGLGAVAWGVFLLPSFWQQAPLRVVASELLGGYTFKPQWLQDKSRQVEAAEQSSLCNPATLHDIVVMRLAILDGAIATADQTSIAAAYTPLYNSARTALTCLPADPFVWLTLFWLDASKNGFTPTNANYLRFSYALGPNEAWIGLWRSRLAFSMFARLPDYLSDDALHDFIGLLDTAQLYRETAEIFAKTAPAAQSRILARLKNAKVIPRQTFAKMLYETGVDVDVPGVDFSRPHDRPFEFNLPGANDPGPQPKK